MNANDNSVVMKGEMSDNLLTPGMTHDVVPGRAVVIHDACSVKDIARYADMPYRRAGRVRLLRLETFIAYVKDNAAGEVSPVVFVNEVEAKAVFNAAGWGDDVAGFDLCKSAEWREWMRHNCSWLSQEEFCDFLEDQQAVIKVPTGVELLDLVANFRQKQSVEFGRSYRGADGQVCVSYQEKTTGATRDMALPAEFKLHLPVIKGAENMTTYEVRARLKVRVDKENHKLALRYELIRPDVPVDNAVRDIADWLRCALADAEVYEGSIVESVREALC
ncbi:MAG: DUF2303 family protein [Akkermansia sp.]|nr:DUF2303 family protein [Akkermansia sp.]MBR5186479.1 DUF2303 family protein [Akkermansia sp.]